MRGMSSTPRLETQQRHNVDLARLLDRGPATRSATAAATAPTAQHGHERGKEAAPGWGIILDAASHSGLARHPKPGQILNTRASKKRQSPG
jgi:hypothetical protein